MIRRLHYKKQLQNKRRAAKQYRGTFRRGYDTVGDARYYHEDNDGLARFWRVRHRLTGELIATIRHSIWRGELHVEFMRDSTERVFDTTQRGAFVEAEKAINDYIERFKIGQSQ